MRVIATLRSVGASWEPIYAAASRLLVEGPSLENACVEGGADNVWNVLCVNGALCRMLAMMLANAGKLERVARGLNVDGECGCDLR